MPPVLLEIDSSWMKSDPQDPRFTDPYMDPWVSLLARPRNLLTWYGVRWDSVLFEGLDMCSFLGHMLAFEDEKRE